MLRALLCRQSKLRFPLLQTACSLLASSIANDGISTKFWSPLKVSGWEIHNGKQLCKALNDRVEGRKLWQLVIRFLWRAEWELQSQWQHVGGGRSGICVWQPSSVSLISPTSLLNVTVVSCRFCPLDFELLKWGSRARSWTDWLMGRFMLWPVVLCKSCSESKAEGWFCTRPSSVFGGLVGWFWSAASTRFFCFSELVLPFRWNFKRAVILLYVAVWEW